MNNSEAVYLLSTFPDNKRHRAFAFAKPSGFFDEDDFHIGYFKEDGSARVYSGTWVTRELIGDVTRKYDYATVLGFLPALSQRAVDTLADVVLANGELLPVEAPARAGEWWVYNVTTVVDALDHARSEVSYFVDGKPSAVSIAKHVFDPAKVAGLTIFRIPQMCRHVYVTQAVVDRIRGAGLYGMELAKVWPLPDDVHWLRLFRDEQKLSLEAAVAGKAKAKAKPQSREWDAVKKYATRALNLMEVKELAEGMAGACKKYGLESDWADARAVLGGVEGQLRRLRMAGSADVIRTHEDEAFGLSLLIGEAFVRGCGWSWKMIQADGGETLGVVSPDGGLGVAVFEIVKNLGSNQAAEMNLVLLLNMVQAGEFSGVADSLKLIG